MSATAAVYRQAIHFLSCLRPCAPTSQILIRQHMRQHAAMFSAKQVDTYDLFNYTSGRWLYNEQKRLDERRLEFDIPALVKAAAAAVDRGTSDVRSIRKIAEGGFHRVLELTLSDGLQLIARLPYPSTQPRSLAVASEVATMDLVARQGIRAPKVYAYSTSNSSNPVGADYIIMEKLEGRCLGDIWSDLSVEQKVSLFDQIAEQEAKLLGINFPAYGSIYYDADLPEHMQRVKINAEGSFCVGPDVSVMHWYQSREYLSIERSAALTPLQVLEAGARKEIAWLQKHGKPRLPFSREYCEVFKYEKVEPAEHVHSLQTYLKIAARLVPKKQALHRPILRHPDLNPNNVFVDDDLNVQSLIDWQHSTVLPIFIHEGIPKDMQQFGGTESQNTDDNLYPSDLHAVAEDGRSTSLEYHRQRHAYLHCIRSRMSKLDSRTRYDDGMSLKKLYQHVAEPWEGNSIPLKACLADLERVWPANEVCPSMLDEKTTQDTMTKLHTQRKINREMRIVRLMYGIGVDGWVSTERFDQVQAAVAELKIDELSLAENDFERSMIEKHWPFDDFEEDE